MPAKSFNFQGVTALIVDADNYSVEIVAKMLRGFGLDANLSAGSEQEGWRLLEEQQSIDLVICDSSLASPVGNNFVEQLRRSDNPSRKFIPIIVLSAHSDKGNVVAARDSGANNVIRKPVSATVLYDRVVWAVSNNRKFVDSATYIGPDRRFRNLGPPDGVGRRSTDLSTSLGEASEPNLSQNEIDSFMTPMKMKNRLMAQGTARFIEVETRASRMLSQPGGIQKDQAVASAEEGVENLRDSHIAVVTRLIGEIEPIAFNSRTQFEPAELTDLLFKTNIVFNLAGTHGFVLLQGIAESLLDLIAVMQAKSNLSSGGVHVHVMALAMMGTGAKPLSPTEAKTMMTRLHDVVDHFGRTDLNAH